MMINITAIRDKGNIQKERVVCKVLSATDVGRHLLTKNKLNDKDGLTATIIEAYWFPDKKVEAGDFVVIYTKPGDSSETKFKDVTSHFFYWGKTQCIWTDPRSAAVMLHAPDWETFKNSDGAKA